MVSLITGIIGIATAIAIVIVVIKTLLMDIEHSRNSINLQRLTQRIALLESDLREMQGKSSKANPGSGHSGLDETQQE